MFDNVKAFLAGAASTLDIGATLYDDEYNNLDNNDVAALSEIWQSVGGYIRGAMHTYEAQQ